MMWRIGTNEDGTVDEVVMDGAFVHLEDLGDAYMLIVENGEQHIHLTIPARKQRKAFVYEQHEPTTPPTDDGCPVVTTVAGDPWHGCSLAKGHEEPHDFSVRLYGAYPEFGITTPTDDERESDYLSLEEIGEAMLAASDRWDGDEAMHAIVLRFIEHYSTLDHAIDQALSAADYEDDAPIWFQWDSDSGALVFRRQGPITEAEARAITSIESLALTTGIPHERIVATLDAMRSRDITEAMVEAAHWHRWNFRNGRCVCGETFARERGFTRHFLEAAEAAR